MSSADTGEGTATPEEDADPVAEAGDPNAVAADTTSAPEATEPAPGDDKLRVVLDAFSAELGDDLLVTEHHRDDVWLRVRPTAWRRTAEVAKSIGFDYFCFLSGLDWMPATSLMRAEVSSSEVTEDEAAEDPEGAAEAEAANEAITDDVADEPAESDGSGAWKTGHAGGDTRFQVFARLYSIERHLGITLKADLDDEAPAVETWSEVYPGADWHERETWEMYGFDFVGHPHIRHLYLPGEFEGFPLRKDFPLLAREVKPWPGLVDVEPMPETEEAEAAAAPATADGGEAS